VLFALVALLHPLHLTQRAGVTAIAFTDRAGLPLGTVLTRDGERTVRVPLERVSPAFLTLIVSTEDARFYGHGGVDIFALARAASQVLRTGHVHSGGSTITMQVARMHFGVPHTLWGKFEELALAPRIESGTTKPEILAEYVNGIPMGGNITGVEAAARIYFGVPASDLDLAQAALLAALPNDPIGLDPYTHRAALEARRIRLLDRLATRGTVPAADISHAKAEKLAILPGNSGIYAAPQLLFRLSAMLPANTASVRTTIDRNMQTYVEAESANVVSVLRDRNVTAASAVVIDNHTGAVLAYVGSPNYFDAQHQGSNDGVTALRQPGSTLKPFLYELAFERRIVRPTTILADVPTAYALPGRRIYAPADYSERFAGPVRARVALANSLNVPAVRVLSATGVRAFLQRLHALGFAHLTRSPETYGLGLTLGSGEVTLEELAGAFATAANGGRPLQVHMLANDDAKNANAPVVGDASTWMLVTDMLSDAHARAREFGVDSLLRLPFPVAVKTGTSSDFRDTWTVGYTRDYTVAVWVGNFDGSPMQRVSGVTGAAPLWSRIMLHLHERHEPQAFALPAGYARTPMCATTGVRPNAECPAVVSELLDQNDRIALGGPAPKLGHDYDAWLAQQPPATTDGLRIVAPRDETTFVFARGARIAFDARGAGDDVAWTRNGKIFAEHRARWFWPVQRGNWEFVASRHGHDARVTIHVTDAPLSGSARGFSVLR
jgi:penicillin-binding protein 1C